ncbi:MAG: flavocytochrome c [Burkholderiales bacterium]|jgi:fumarate reductase flavoprotein subunit|nr:flavocytochrome c [Burkholderiales bacterium]
MDRRQVLKIGTAAALLTGSKLSIAQRAEETTDVVVVGSGGSGLTAAITAFDAGAKVIVLEKMPITGGNSQLSAGGMNAANTVIQKQKNIEDNWEIMFQDTMKGGKEINNPQLVEILAKNSSASIDFLLSIGGDMTDVGRMAGASVNRCHRPAGGEAVGHNLIHTLRQNAIKRNMDVRTGSRAIKLLVEGGKIVGVEVQDRHGRKYNIKSSAVVLASGGFSANLERVTKYRPEYAGFSSTNQPGATGDGLDLAAAVGAKLRDMEQIQIHPTQAAGSKILITEAVRGNGAIMINREGKRFVNELTTRDAASAAVLKQTGGTAFLVFDQNIRKSLKQIEGYYHLELCKEGATPQELAKVCGITDGDALAETIKKYNEYQEAKKDEEFGRADMPRPIKEANFIAIEIRPGIHYTMGGVVFDTQTRVLNESNQPIHGLYGAGEVTGGVHGANRLGGNSISETITFGRIAGAQAAAYAKANKKA